jgi:hypothetical protein
MLQITDFSFAQDLQTVGMYVIEVAHQVSARAGHAHSHFIEMPLGGALAGDPMPFEFLAKIFEKYVSADSGGFQGNKLKRFVPIASW